MKRLSIIVLIIISALFLAISTPFILHPSLYSLDEKSSTLYHQNPDSSGQYSQVRSEDIHALMQELLDDPESIILNVKLKNFEMAKEDFYKYKTKSRHFDTIVISFNLNETTIGNFNRNNLRNVDNLERIINESARFEEINRLEIQYRSEDNPALLYTIVYEGEAVYSALKKATAQLREGERDIIEISSTFNLNTSQYHEAVDILDAIIEEDQVKQQERVQNRPQLIRSSLSISVTPGIGQYGDILKVDGATTFLEISDVTLVLDSRDLMSLQPDANGRFSTTLPIGRIRSGEHVIFAIAGTHYSNLATFIVTPADTELTIEANPKYTTSKIFCSGRLFAGEIPVTDAIVRIFVDDLQMMTARTDKTGFFGTSIDITHGNHTIQAIFDDPAFPLNPSESRVQSVLIEPSTMSPLALLIGSGVVILGFLGGVWYLGGFNSSEWKKKRPELASSHIISDTNSIKQEFIDSSLHRSAPTDILTRYQILFDSGKGSEAAFLLYQSLIGQFIPFQGSIDPSTLTPREFATLLAATSYERSIQEFVIRYEEVRYGGLSLQPNDILLSKWRESYTFSEAVMDGLIEVP